MSTSDKRRDPAVRHGVVAAAVCLAASVVYEAFSHGVLSYFMLLMFLCPLCDAGFFSIIRRPPRWWARCLLHTGVAALTLGCFVRGALDIYGTTSEWTALYFALGAPLALSGAAACLLTGKGLGDGVR